MQFEWIITGCLRAPIRRCRGNWWLLHRERKGARYSDAYLPTTQLRKLGKSDSQNVTHLCNDLLCDSRWQFAERDGLTVANFSLSLAFCIDLFVLTNWAA